MSDSVRRPWYLSLTLRWDDAEDDRQVPLLGTVAGMALQMKAAHHLDVAPKSRHSTLMPLVKVISFPEGWDAECWMKQGLDEVNGALGPLQEKHGPVDLKFEEVRGYDNRTVLNFCGGGRLSEIRAELWTRLWEVTCKVADRLGGTSELRGSGSKCTGPRIWGSVARSPSRGDSSALCWLSQSELLASRFEEWVGEKVRFSQAWLLVSDEALSNPLGQSRAHPIHL